MRDSRVQKAYASGNRPLKSDADRNRKSQKPSQKSLTPEFPARAEDALGFGSQKNSIDSSSGVEKSEENHLVDSSESQDSTGSMTLASSSTISSVSHVEESPLLVQLLPSGSSAHTKLSSSHDSTGLMTPASSTITFKAVTSSEASSLMSGTGSNSKARTVKEEGVSSSSVEVEAVLKSFRAAQLQGLKAKNMDLLSKRILDAVVKVVLEDMPVERDIIDELMAKKGYLVLLVIVLWIFALFAFLFNSSRGTITYIGAAVPT